MGLYKKKRVTHDKLMRITKNTLLDVSSGMKSFYTKSDSLMNFKRVGFEFSWTDREVCF